jgi:hypothetical protein
MSDTNDFTLLENRLREPFLRMVSKYGRQKYGLWMVWTYMLWRSTNGQFCVPEKLVLNDLGMNKNTLPTLRNILVQRRVAAEGCPQGSGWEMVDSGLGHYFTTTC